MRSRGRHRPFLIIGLAVAAIAACDSPTGPGPAPDEITELPRSLTTAETRAISAGNEFGLELLRRLHGERSGENSPATDGEEETGDANVFISPLSASMALGMALNGADGETFDAMRDALALEGVGLEEANQAYHALTELLLGLDPSVEFSLANGVWLKEEFPFLAEYESRVADVFDARIENVASFEDPTTIGSINDWVDGVTSGQIDRLIHPEEVGTNTVALLANAVYFRGDWTNRFDRGETAPAEFRRPDGTTVTVPTMHRMFTSDQARVGGGADHVAVDLPYGGGAFSMTVVVPEDDATLDQIVEQADAEWWASLVGTLRDGKADVWLPRFELTYEKYLNDVLKAMGMEIAFRLGEADFTRMVEGPGSPAIQWVKQKSFVSVDEEGTEAAAATGVTLNVSGPAVIRADRPFLFAIRERLSGTILFIGTVTDPTAA